MRGDDGWGGSRHTPNTPGTETSETHVGTRASSRSRRAPNITGTGVRRRVLVALALLLLIVLLTVGLYTAVIPTLTQAIGALATSGTVAPATTRTGRATTTQRPISASPLTTAAPGGTAPPTNADWFAFTTEDGGFRVDVPGALGSSHGYFINDFSGQGADFAYTGSPLTTPLQRREAQTELSILYSTKITDHNICPQGGDPVRIGSETATTSAWQRDEGADVKVNLVLNGTAIEIILSSRDSSQSALAQYGDIWRHMLASFAPVPKPQQAATHPCG